MCNTQKFFVIELYWVQLSGSWIHSSTLALIVSASFKAAGHRSKYFCWLPLEHKASTLALDPTHCSRDKHSARPHVNRKKQKETIFFPCLVCLLRHKKCKQIVSVTGRRGLSMIRQFFLCFPSWSVNIRMDLQEVGCGYMEWIGLAQDRDRWRTLVSAVMDLRVPWNAGNFLTSCKPVSFSRRTLHHGVSK